MFLLKLLIIVDLEKIQPELEKGVMLRDKLLMSHHSEDLTKESISLQSILEIKLSKTLKIYQSAWLMKSFKPPPIIQTAHLLKRKMILRKVPKSIDEIKII